MKILYDCFSCSPYYGSDEGIGWLWPYHMRRYHEVWVLVRKDRRKDIERYCREHEISDMNFIYADIPDWMNFYYRNKKTGKNGTIDFLAYQMLWQFPAYRLAKKLHKEIHFDIVHHVSTNDFRLLGRLYRLGAPFFIGPIGGAQETPIALQDYIDGHKKNEYLRTILNILMIHLPGYQNALKCARRIFFSNQETQKFLIPYISDSYKCTIMTEVGFSGEIDFEHIERKKRNLGCTFLWAGRMEYRKGLELLFDALDRLPREAVWTLLLCGDGSEREKYQRIISQKTYASKVNFCGRVPYEEMHTFYDKADAFVFPSLRETTGTVIIEAMAHGLPVIALQQGGAVEVITADEGYLVSGTTKEEYICGIAEAMQQCIDHEELCRVKGLCAAKKIKNRYTWEAKAKFMNCVYESTI